MKKLIIKFLSLAKNSLFKSDPANPKKRKPTKTKISPDRDNVSARSLKRAETKDFLKKISLIMGGVLAAAAALIIITVVIGYQRDKAIEIAAYPEDIAERIPPRPIKTPAPTAVPTPSPSPAPTIPPQDFPGIIKTSEEEWEEELRSVELTDLNRDNFANMEFCRISTSRQKINMRVSADSIPISDDEFYYLFALQPYESTISEGNEYILKKEKNTAVGFSVNLNHNTESSRLYQKFVVAVKCNGVYVPVSHGQYITNPEAVARYTAAFPQAASKKGLLVDPNRLRGNELDELGVKQAAYNIFVGRILGQTTDPVYPTIHYQYNGKTYAFNGQVISEYDLVFSTLTAKGITVTAIILNDYSASHPHMIHPKSRSGSESQYYAFNAAEAQGVEYLAAIGSFLAERYSGNNGCGRVSSWIIANEINARKEWNHMEKVSLQEYTDEYAKAFRIFYNAIKSVTANAKVYISLDQQWDRNLSNNPNYDARDILDEFNRNIKGRGNIDWGLAQHPYCVPLTISSFWAPSRYVNHTVSTPMLTMGNISILTDYMAQEHFLTDDGEVRSITLSELGYSSLTGEAMQAAAFAYAYYIVESNPHIDSLLLNRQTDAAEEVAQGLAFGLNHQGGGQKQIYTVFKYIDTPEHAQYTEFAKGIIGISDWSEVIG